jgi:MSHA biogenesis protein MshJ
MSASASLLTRFDKLSLRERALVALAVLAGCVGLWDIALMQPLRNQRNALTQELSTYNETVGSSEQADQADPHRAAIMRLSDLQTQSQTIDAQLTSGAAGFVPAPKMVEVVHDVLSQQHGLKLISIRNLPMTSLVPPATETAQGTAPYVHPIELVIEGEYGDVLNYLQALEALPWRFRWKTLDLTTKQYPVNRVRIELSTLSMDKTWLGVGS